MDENNKLDPWSTQVHAAFNMATNPLWTGDLKCLHTLRAFLLARFSNMAANAGATSKSNPSKKEKETLLAVLQFLKKNKLPVI